MYVMLEGGRRKPSVPAKQTAFAEFQSTKCSTKVEIYPGLGPVHLYEMQCSDHKILPSREELIKCSLLQRAIPQKLDSRI